MTLLGRVFPRPLLAIMGRPTSIGLLLLAVTLAVGFSLLGQWQLSRAVHNGDVAERPTETVLPLSEVAQPQEPTPSDAVGQLVSATGQWVAGDFQALRDRVDNGRDGYWTVGHFQTDEGDSLAVALGWTQDRQAALDAADRWNADQTDLPGEVTGRYQHAEAPSDPDGEDPLVKEMAPASFVNEWQDPGPTYPGYVTLRSAPAPLESIWSPPPVAEVTLNFLNVFYAAEWVLFAGVALYIWYRLMRDIYDREQDADGGETAGEGPDPEPERTEAERTPQRATVD